jgi:preprotein translocase SecE subunit
VCTDDEHECTGAEQLIQTERGIEDMAYKKDQGRYARLAAFWSLAILAFYGITSLYEELAQRVTALAKPIVATMPKIPVLGVSFNGAMLICTVALVGAIWLIYRWQQTPKVADLLIETETELRKVTWPTMPEAINSSLVVIACVIFLMAFLAGADWILAKWATRILTGGG